MDLDDQLGRLSPPQAKRAKRQCHFDSKWVQEFPGIGVSNKS
jgi:hypothetical protein